MREAGGHHRLSGADSLGEDTGTHLFAGVIRKQDDLRATEQLLEALGRYIEVLQAHHVPYPEIRRQSLQATTVGRALRSKDVGMGSARHDVMGSRIQAVESRHRPDAPFDPLAGSQ